MKVYVASSWRNKQQPYVVQRLRSAGYETYDFRKPKKEDSVFHWTEIDPDWQSWTPQKFHASLNHPLAINGFKIDFEALQESDVVVLVNPCGRSSHLELGWAAGAGKITIVLLADGEPELSYKLADHIALSIDEVISVLDSCTISPGTDA